MSLAAPVIAGMVALIRAKYPTMDAANVINRLIKTAKPAGGATPNDHYGYGIPNVAKALTAHVASVSQNPLGSLAPAPGWSVRVVGVVGAVDVAAGITASARPLRGRGANRGLERERRRHVDRGGRSRAGHRSAGRLVRGTQPPRHGPR